MACAAAAVLSMSGALAVPLAVMQPAASADTASTSVIAIAPAAANTASATIAPVVDVKASAEVAGAAELLPRSDIYMLLVAGLVWGLWFARRSARREFAEAEPPRASGGAAGNLGDRRPGIRAPESANPQP